MSAVMAPFACMDLTVVISRPANASASSASLLLLPALAAGRDLSAYSHSTIKVSSLDNGDCH